MSEPNWALPLSREELIAECERLRVAEAIHWIRVDEALPDDASTVLIFAPELSEPVWLGYIEDETWHTIDGGEIDDDTVMGWAPMPRGPA